MVETVIARVYLLAKLPSNNTNHELPNVVSHTRRHKFYEITDNTLIVFSPKDNTLVLEDPQGSLTVEEVLKRKGP